MNSRDDFEEATKELGKIEESIKRAWEELRDEAEKEGRNGKIPSLSLL